MKGDFTRVTFEPWRRYTGVLMQQGRVQLDSDWQESFLAGLLLGALAVLVADAIAARLRCEAKVREGDHMEAAWV